MSHLKKFSYPEISRRKLIIFLTFLNFFILTAYTSTIVLKIQNFFPYNETAKFLISASLVSLLIGNIFGKIIYRKISNSKILTVFIAALFFISISAGFIFISFIKKDISIIDLYFNHFAESVALLLVPSALTGLLNCYYLKICTGDFIDDKNLLTSYIFCLFSASAFGLLSSIYIIKFFNSQILFLIFASISFMLPIISLFIKKLEYNADPLFAQHYMDDEPKDQLIIKVRDDLFFTYINFSLVLIYLFLGFILFIKFNGNTLTNLFLYVASLLLTMSLSIHISNVFKLKYWHIFSEILYPIFFILTFFIIILKAKSISLYSGLLLLNIPAIIYGFSLNQTISNIIQKFDHQKRFNVCDFSLYILPIPILVILSFVFFTNYAFFGILYSIMLINLIIPGIFIFNLHKSFKTKITYLLVFLLLIPSIILGHNYAGMKLNNDLFVANTVNYESLRKINYNNPYISGNDVIEYKKSPIFHVSDSRIQNLKRAAAVAALFSGNNSEILSIDSNQQFFRNPVFNYFIKFHCLNNVNLKEIDYNRLPVSGNIKYETLNSGILSFLKHNKRLYDIIIDFPNITDQNFNNLRFSMKYIQTLKSTMHPTGIYIKLFDINYQKPSVTREALLTHNKIFKNNIVFIFSNFIVIASSNDENSLKISKESISNIEQIIENKKYGYLFFDARQILNNILFTSIDSLLSFFESPKTNNNKIIHFTAIPDQLNEYYLTYEPSWYNFLLNDSKAHASFNSSILSFFKQYSIILKLFRQTDYFESVNDYENETSSLFKIKKMSSFRPELREYISEILDLKKKNYYSRALYYEKRKDWDRAETLYKAILAIDIDNFEANYKIGLLYLTVQQFDNAFKYISKALKLNKNHPNVLYQMGVLMFSDNKPDRAIEFLERAYEKNEKHAQLFMYLGLSYMKKNNFTKAEEYLNRAHTEDPNDNKIITLLDEVKKALSEKNNFMNPDNRTSMLDDEKDEEIDLPINKKALKSRLSDDGK